MQLIFKPKFLSLILHSAIWVLSILFKVAKLIQNYVCMVLLQFSKVFYWLFSSIWWKKVWRINRSANRLSILSTKLDGFSLANDVQFTKFAKLSPCQTFLLYSIMFQKLIRWAYCIIGYFEDYLGTSDWLYRHLSILAICKHNWLGSQLSRHKWQGRQKGLKSKHAYMTM